jgi:hypothetical protein
MRCATWCCHGLLHNAACHMSLTPTSSSSLSLSLPSQRCPRWHISPPRGPHFFKQLFQVVHQVRQPTDGVHGNTASRNLTRLFRHHVVHTRSCGCGRGVGALPRTTVEFELVAFSHDHIDCASSHGRSACVFRVGCHRCRRAASQWRRQLSLSGCVGAPRHGVKPDAASGTHGRAAHARWARQPCSSRWRVEMGVPAVEYRGASSSGTTACSL